MCFSAESSFTSAALLAGLSFAAAKQVRRKGQIPLVFIPFVFMLMQLSEGFTWLALERNFYPSFLVPFGSYFFLFISHFYWTLIVPFIYMCAETDPKRKKILKSIFYGVCAVAAGILALEIMAPRPPESQIVQRSIQYTFSTFEAYPLLDRMKGPLLALIMIGPAFISTLPGRWILTGIVVASYLIAMSFYDYAFTSVWCFFGTAASVAVLWILHRMNRAEK